ncbi:MAG: transcriptional repressor [Simkaniaceae bacterium]|nr:transcriptional repressor [Simkaniaceae bacterium]
MNKIPELQEIFLKEDLRYTRQREIIWQEICSSDEHRDAEDIYFTLKKRGVAVSRATVYRTIEVLVRNNLVRALNIGDGRFRYEKKLDQTHHDHLVCTECGKIIEFFDINVEKQQEKIAKDHGFTLIRHIHQLFGVCEECQKN